MSDFKNTKEIYEHLLAGGKVQHKYIESVLFIKEDGNLNDQTLNFVHPLLWKKHIEPKKKVKLYKYACETESGNWMEPDFYYKDDALFSKDFPSIKNFIKLENNFIEVEED